MRRGLNVRSKLFVAIREWVIESFQDIDNLGWELFSSEHEVIRPPTDTRISSNSERLYSSIFEVRVRHQELKVLHAFFAAQTRDKMYGGRPTRPLEV